jgi:hypothetical protein
MHVVRFLGDNPKCMMTIATPPDKSLPSVVSQRCCSRAKK